MAQVVFSVDLKVVLRDDRKLVLEITGEDHTLGNMLMKELLRHPQVEYAAYRVPHPLRDVIELAVVVKNGADVGKVLVEVIESLKDQLVEFKKAVEEALG